MVPFPRGGSTDTYGRIVRRKLAENLGQSIVIDNRAGAGGSLSAELGAKAVPDGYTIWLARVVARDEGKAMLEKDALTGEFLRSSETRAQLQTAYTELKAILKEPGLVKK